VDISVSELEVLFLYSNSIDCQRVRERPRHLSQFILSFTSSFSVSSRWPPLLLSPDLPSFQFPCTGAFVVVFLEILDLALAATVSQVLLCLMYSLCVDELVLMSLDEPLRLRCLRTF